MQKWKKLQKTKQKHSIVHIFHLDVITDVQVGQDLIGLRGDLSFTQLAIAQTNNNTLISMKDTGELLATLNGIQASLITQQALIAV